MPECFDHFTHAGPTQQPSLPASTTPLAFPEAMSTSLDTPCSSNPAPHGYVHPLRLATRSILLRKIKGSVKLLMTGLCSGLSSRFRAPNTLQTLRVEIGQARNPEPKDISLPNSPPPALRFRLEIAFGNAGYCRLWGQ